MSKAAEAWRAKRRGNGAEMTKMEQGYQNHVDRARGFSRAYDRECQWAGVTFAPEEIADLLKGCGYGGE